MHLTALEAMGATIHLEQGYVLAEAPPGGLRGVDFLFDGVTVTGTENIMMAAVLAKGRTVLRNAALEPEVVDLADALNGMGARIHGAGSAMITIEGVGALSGGAHHIMADRIETGTYMTAAAATGGRVVLRGAPIGRLNAVQHKLTQAGCHFETSGEDLVATGPNGSVPRT